jgi:hypothetical protein
MVQKECILRKLTKTIQISTLKTVRNNRNIFMKLRKNMWQKHFYNIDLFALLAATIGSFCQFDCPCDMPMRLPMPPGFAFPSQKMKLPINSCN